MMALPLPATIENTIVSEFKKGQKVTGCTPQRQDVKRSGTVVSVNVHSRGSHVTVKDADGKEWSTRPSLLKLA